MLKSLLIGLMIVTSLTSRAQDAISISKGEQAPFSGILFPQVRANQIRAELIEKDILTVRVSSLTESSFISERIIKLKDTEIELYKKQNHRLESANQTSNTMNAIYFGLGVLLTGAAVYGAGALSR